MIFCFDVDGTITAQPDIFKEIMRGLKAIGHTVYVLTGTILGSDPTPQESRDRQLGDLGFKEGEHFDEIIICQGYNWADCGELKGQFCKEKGVDFMIDDADPFIDSINRWSPNTLCVKMPLTKRHVNGYV
jgi:hypothetical protein